MKTRNRKSESELLDPGFGVRGEKSERILGKDGQFRVKREGLRFQRVLDLYNSLITMSWKKFTWGVIVFYTVLNSLFAMLYFLLGSEGLNGVVAHNSFERFLEDWFFSAQTLTTVGYGRINPIGFLPSLVAAIESLIGLLGFALATGLLYGRFSRPAAKVLFSENMLLAPYKGMSGLMLRVANMRSNQLLEVETIITLIMNEKGLDGKMERKFYGLQLERSQVTYLALSWTIVHPVDDKSPIYGYSAEDLAESDAEFIVLIKAYDEAFSSHVHARFSYKFHEVVWGARFLPMFEAVPGVGSVLKLQRINQWEPASLPEHPASVEVMLKQS